MALCGEYEPSPWSWVREQVDAIRASGTTAGADLNGRPIILLTTVGARSGKLRMTPLMRVEHHGQYALVASLGGAPKHPVWYWNVKANPKVDVQDGATTKEYDAREAVGAEKDLWWQRAVAAYPDYADYQCRTEREIPLFVLSPRA